MLRLHQVFSHVIFGWYWFSSLDLPSKKIVLFVFEVEGWNSETLSCERVLEVARFFENQVCIANGSPGKGKKIKKRKTKADNLQVGFNL